MWIVPPANDEGRGAVVDEGVELVGLESPVSRFPIDVDTDDPTVFWARAKANSLHTGVVSQLLNG
tara:strand:- start:481 stop:675 length:195 start_codon:yes stop_codon:yes gene_type:complete